MGGADKGAKMAARFGRLVFKRFSSKPVVVAEGKVGSFVGSFVGSVFWPSQTREWERIFVWDRARESRHFRLELLWPGILGLTRQSLIEASGLSNAPLIKVQGGQLRLQQRV